jgi:hypothetical protein
VPAATFESLLATTVVSAITSPTRCPESREIIKYNSRIPKGTPTKKVMTQPQKGKIEKKKVSKKLYRFNQIL